MQAAIFSLLPVRTQSTVASVRLAVWLSKTLNIPLYDDDHIARGPALDVLFIVNGSTLYCKHLDAIAAAVRAARHVVWVQNDYTLPPPKAESGAQSPFRKAFADRKLTPHYWTTVYSNSRLTPYSTHINWNMLGFNAEAPQAELDNDAPVYYGAWRAGRAGAFHYIDRCFPRGWTVSSTSKKFATELEHAVLVEPWRGDSFWRELSSYGLGVYAQDKASALDKHCPATRLYEMMSVGLPVVFTPDCIPTMKYYKKDAELYTLTPQNADKLIADRRLIAEEQQVWHNKFHVMLELFVKDEFKHRDWMK